MPQHEAVFGTTGSGKSFYAQVSAMRWPGPVLFWNPQAQPMDIGEWTTVTPDDSLNALKRCLQRKRARVVYHPHWNEDIARNQLTYIVTNLMRTVWSPPLLIVVDEFDQIAPEGKRGTACHQIALRGRKMGVWGMFVTLHPAIVSKSIVRQCTRKTVFVLEDSAVYLKTHSMPGEQIDKILDHAPPFSYLVWQDRKLSGPFRE